MNEIPVFNMSAGHNIKSQLPVSEWVLKGENVFKIKINPLPGHESYEEESPCTVNIVNKDAEEDKILGTAVIPVLTELNNSPIKNDIIYSVKFNFNSSIREHYWGNGLEITNTKEAKLKLIEISNYFIGCFQKNDIKSIIELLKVREQELAYYYNENYLSRIARLTESFQQKMGNGNLKFEPINIENTVMEYYLNNKIVCLKNINYASAIIGYNNDIPITVFYPFYFCLNPSREFVIIK